MRWLLLLLVALLYGCKTSDPPVSAAVVENAPAEEDFPESCSREHVAEQIGMVYDVAVDTMTGDYFRNHPELYAEHTEALRQHVLEQQPREDFIQMIINGPDSSSASSDAQVESQTEFSEQDFTVLFNVAVRMAQMTVGSEMSVYAAKYVDEDPVKIELFEMEQSGDYSSYISWVFRELQPNELDEEYRNRNDIRKDDRLFEFMSSPESWEQLHGRRGYLIVRNGKIYDAIITVLN